MLGEEIEDPRGIEGNIKSITGLGIFKIKTSIAEEKVTKQREITKYKEVPVNVEKQRTVTESKKVSLWQIIFKN